MGLDLVVEGRAKPGHEREWRELISRSFVDPDNPGDKARFEAISVPGYAAIGAPQVGSDPVADAWIAKARGVGTSEERERLVEEFRGYHVLALIECDGIPQYTHAGLYEGIDETSFRGAFLIACEDVLDQATISEAWEHRMPEEAEAYGRKLLEAVVAARATGPIPHKRSLLERIGLARQNSRAESFDEQLSIVEAAGRWFIFWGERGHAIRAWF